MSVYVDEPIHPFGNMVMCHMWADSHDELLAMVDWIDVQRKWIQRHPRLSFGKHRHASWRHYDIAKSKRAFAVKAGVVETDRYGAVEHTAIFAVASDDPVRVTRARRMLDRIAAARANRLKETLL